jgi:hypothetical protein
MSATLEITGQHRTMGRFVIISGVVPMSRAEAEQEIRSGAVVHAFVWGDDGGYHDERGIGDPHLHSRVAGLWAEADGLHYRAADWVGSVLNEDKVSWYDLPAHGDATLAERDEVYGTAAFAIPSFGGSSALRGRGKTQRLTGWF